MDQNSSKVVMKLRMLCTVLGSVMFVIGLLCVASGWFYLSRFVRIDRQPPGLAFVMVILAALGNAVSGALVWHAVVDGTKPGSQVIEAIVVVFGFTKVMNIANAFIFGWNWPYYPHAADWVLLGSAISTSTTAMLGIPLCWITLTLLTEIPNEPAVPTAPAASAA